MELADLRVFESVARNLNITNAAAELGMSQPAVSSRLKQLEREFNARFYVRNNHGVELTTHGNRLLAALQPILERLETVDAAFKAPDRTRLQRPFVVGGSNILSATLLPDLLVEFKRRYPDSDLIVETSTSRRMEELVQNRAVEVAVVTSPSTLPGLECEFLMEHEAVAFAKPGNPLCERVISLEELSNIPVIVRKGSSIVSELEERGCKLTYAARFSSIESVKTAARGGMGIGLLFRTRVETDFQNGTLAMLKVSSLEQITLKMYVLYRKGAKLSTNTRNFLKIVRDTVRSEAAIGYGLKVSAKALPAE